ncbi:hypothetical protein CBR_g6428 [Chara braunii]|uniref:IPT/TIG domain-containing protein n=1 Tax=Chara braunii TaxID=69332 RepID=A0A388KJS0_CHABU|nr:hypothetical protein CBR_g6428 [Chara braunii]|eukprot:GBG70300.1 hypothetical protein CBR_g6428 [Chara braunii]
MITEYRDPRQCELTYNSSLTPSLISVYPTEGTDGTAFKITGKRFTDNVTMVEVLIGGVLAEVISTNVTTISAVARPGMKSGPSDVEVFILGAGKAIANATAARVLIKTLKVTSASPAFVVLQGRTLVTVLGSGFRTESAKLSVRFGTGTSLDRAEVLQSSITDTSFICVSPPGIESYLDSAPVDIHVYLDFGNSTESVTLSAAATYIDPMTSELDYVVPLITSVSPSEAQAARTGELLIEGWFPGYYVVEKKYDDVIVHIGDDSTACVVISMTVEEIVCQYFTLTTGDHRVTVSLSGNGSTITADPVIRVFYGIFSISPQQGSMAGGTLVTIKGEGFVPSADPDWANVVFMEVPKSSMNPNGVVACNVENASSSEILCRTEGHCWTDESPTLFTTPSCDFSATSPSRVYLTTCKKNLSHWENLRCWGSDWRTVFAPCIDADTKQEVEGGSPCLYEFSAEDIMRMRVAILVAMADSDLCSLVSSRARLSTDWVLMAVILMLEDWAMLGEDGVDAVAEVTAADEVEADAATATAAR